MAYRSTRKLFPTQAAARRLYVEDQLSLREISQRLEEPVKTLRAWRNLGGWEALKEKNAKTELDRLKDLRNGLIDRAEAQLKEGKLPHIEIGLLYKLERVIDQRKKNQDLPKVAVLHALKKLTFDPYDGELNAILRKMLLEFSASVSEENSSRSPK